MTERIATPFTNEHFAAFCLSMVGQPYWYGTVIYKCSDSLLSRKAEQYPSHYGSRPTSRYMQDIAAKKICADCVGGCKGYAWTDEGKGVLESIGTNSVFSSKYGSNGCPDKSANGMFTYAKSKGMDWGTISTLPEIVGLALHKDGHVGYYVGNGYAVEWKGFSYGCVKTQVKGRGWTHWYKLPFIHYNDEANQITPPVADVPLGSRLLKYGGNALLQKRYVADHLTKVEKNNHGELPKYYAEGTHPAIVPPEMFMRVQAQMEQNRQKNGIAKDAPQYSAFTGMLVCENCGKRYHRKVSRTEVAWNCATYLSLGKKACHTKQIPEDILMAVTASVLDTSKFDAELFRETVQKIRVPSFNQLVFVMKDGTKVEREWQDKSRSRSWADEMRAQAAEHARRRVKGAQSATRREQIMDLPRRTQRLPKESDGR